MANNNKWRRHPWLQFSLGRFLLVIAVVGPLTAFVYSSFVADELRSNGAGVLIDDSVVPRTIVDVLFVQSRFNAGDHAVLCIIVRPGGNSVSFDKTPSIREQPAIDGISVRGSKVFVHGMRVIPQHTPCFLVYQPHSRSVVEIGFDKKFERLTEPKSVVSIPEWHSRVIPSLRSSSLAMERTGVIDGQPKR